MNNRVFRSLLIIGLGLGLSHCSAQDPQHSSLHSQTADVSVQPEALTSQTFWTYFAGTNGDPAYRGYIKFSIALDEQGQFSSLIWHPSQYKYHADHLRTLPAYAGLSAPQFDAITLYNQGRRLLLGTALIPKAVGSLTSPDLIDIQLMGKDALQPELVANIFDLLKNHLPVVPKISYYPVAEQLTFVQQELSRFTALGIKLAEANNSLDRVCYNSGWGVGHVRIVRKGELDGLLAEGAIGTSDILVMDDIPRELPVVAGIVVSQSSSPSSHPALLAGMLGIPFVYEKNATSLESWQQLATNAQPVFFQATGDSTSSCSFLVRSGDALTNAEAAQLAALKKPLPLQMNDYDRTSKDPINLDKLDRTDADKVGAKAANVAALRRLIPDHTVTEGLALPVGLFAEALQTANTADGRNLQTALDLEMSALLAPAVSSKETAEGLVRIRALIEGAKLGAATKTKILDGIKAVFPVGTRIKLRSSSNIEDHPEFNGAGLYESKGACVGDDENKTDTGLCEAKKDAVIKNVQKVWASLYSLKAWVARRYYGVDESRSGMGILVQRSFKGELANGVAISGYPSSNPNGNTVQPIQVQSTSFPGEDLEVTNPPVGKVPETVMITQRDLTLQIPSSEVPRGRMILTDELYRQLYDQIAIIHEHYQKALNPKDTSQFKLDMEWKLVEVDGIQKIVIKQVRPVPMKISSTQGLDRGTILVGERAAKLCPKPSELGKGITKLDLSAPLQMSIALQEIPLDNASEIKNPLESLAAYGSDIALPSTAKIEYTAWSKLWGTKNERRSYTVSVLVPWAGKSYNLKWSGRQERPLAQPRLLLNNVQSIWTSEIQIVADASNFQSYQVVLGSAACESDAYQGYLPGSYEASSPYAQERLPPTAITESYASTDGKGMSVTFDGRSALQSFDKTRFIHIDRTTIKGLLPRDLVITTPLKVVYAPGHHNFFYEYAIELLAADGLTPDEQAQLQARGLKRLVLRSGQKYDSNGWPLVDLFGVDSNGQETVLSNFGRN